MAAIAAVSVCVGSPFRLLACVLPWPSSGSPIRVGLCAAGFCVSNERPCAPARCACLSPCALHGLRAVSPWLFFLPGISSLASTPTPCSLHRFGMLLPDWFSCSRSRSQLRVIPNSAVLLSWSAPTQQYGRIWDDSCLNPTKDVVRTPRK